MYVCKCRKKELSDINGHLGVGREDFAFDFIYLSDACLRFLGAFSNFVVKETNMGKCGRSQKCFRSPETGVTNSLGKVSQWRWGMTRCCEVNRNVLRGEDDKRHPQDEGVGAWETRASEARELTRQDKSLNWWNQLLQITTRMLA